MTRLLQTCRPESRSWAGLNRTQGPVNTPNIQSHRPVSPAMLFKHLLKLTLFCNVNSPRTTLLGMLLHYMHCVTSTQERKRGRNRGRGSKRDGGRNNSGSSARALLLPLSAPWRVWLRDTPTQLRASQPNRSNAPELLSKPPKLDYWDPRSKAYITSTCETLAGLITLNGNAGQIKAGWPVCTLSMPTDGWWKATWASMTGGIVGGFPFWAPIGPRI